MRGGGSLKASRHVVGGWLVSGSYGRCFVPWRLAQHTRRVDTRFVTLVVVLFTRFSLSLSFHSSFFFSRFRSLSPLALRFVFAYLYSSLFFRFWSSSLLLFCLSLFLFFLFLQFPVSLPLYSFCLSHFQFSSPSYPITPLLHVYFPSHPFLSLFYSPSSHCISLLSYPSLPPHFISFPSLVLLPPPSHLPFLSLPPSHSPLFPLPPSLPFSSLSSPYLPPIPSYFFSFLFPSLSSHHFYFTRVAKEKERKTPALIFAADAQTSFFSPNLRSWTTFANTFSCQFAFVGAAVSQCHEH